MGVPRLHSLLGRSKILQNPGVWFPKAPEALPLCPSPYSWPSGPGSAPVHLTHRAQPNLLTPCTHRAGQKIPSGRT